MSFIESMKPMAFVEALKKYKECTICLGEFKEKDQVRVMPECGHIFHARCIDEWLSGHKGICPIDKKTVDFSKRID